MIAVVVLAVTLNGTAQAQVAKLSVKACYVTNCSTGSGSCVNIGEHEGRAYFLTAGHVVRHPGAARITASISLGDGWHDARIEASDGKPDLGIISIPVEDTKGWYEFDVAETVDGDNFQLVGFPEGKDYQKRPATRVRSGEHIVFRSRVHPGDSGGPYIDSKDRVASICWGASMDGNEGYATDCVRIRRWCKERLGFMPVPRRKGGGSDDAPAPPPEKEPTPVPGACNCPDCATKFASLNTQIEELRSRCDKLPAPQQPDTSAIEAKLADMEQRIAAMKDLQKKIDAMQYKIDEVRISGGDTEQLKKELAAIRDLTFQVRSLSPDGKVLSSETKKLGENIDLRLVPKKPAT